jgi:hypothetical protein
MRIQHKETTLDVQIEEITPEKAHAFLALSNGMQTKGRSGWTRYAEDMRNDRWRLTGEPLIFNSKGRLDNGYSRLTACVAAGKPFVTVVIRGADPRSFDVIDTGKSRTLADLLKFRGKEYVCIVGYMAKRLAARDKGVSIGSSAPVTRQEEMAAVRKYPMVEDYARKAQALGSGQPHSLLAFTWFIFGEEFPNKTAEFFRAYSPKDGDTLDSRHPASRLKIKLATEEMNKIDRLRYCFSAMNSFLAGQRPTTLKIDETTKVLNIGNSGKTITIA